MESVTKTQLDAKKLELKTINDEMETILEATKTSIVEREKMIPELNILWDKRDNLRKELTNMERVLLPEVGDGVTVCYWSDSSAFTVVSVAKNGKSFVMKKDDTTLDPNFKPEIIPGGFVGHCVNQNDQSYTYTFNPNASEIKVTLRKNGTWKQEGEKAKSGSTIIVGIRSKFHDYNF